MNNNNYAITITSYMKQISTKTLNGKVVGEKLVSSGTPNNFNIVSNK